MRYNLLVLLKKTEKYITFSAPLEKEVMIISKNEEEITKNISYRLKLIDSARFIASSLSKLINNLAKRIHKIKCKYGPDDKNMKLGIKGFEIKNLGEYHDLYIQSNILMLAGIFQNVLKYMN